MSACLSCPCFVCTELSLLGRTQLFNYRNTQATVDYGQAIDNASSLDASSLGDFGKAFQETLDTLTQALKPQIGTGYFVCLFSVVTGFFLALSSDDAKGLASTDSGKDSFSAEG